MREIKVKISKNTVDCNSVNKKKMCRQKFHCNLNQNFSEQKVRVISEQKFMTFSVLRVQIKISNFLIVILPKNLIFNFSQ